MPRAKNGGTPAKKTAAEDVFEDKRPNNMNRSAAKKRAGVKTGATKTSKDELNPEKLEKLEKLKVIPIETSSFIFEDNEKKVKETTKYECTCCGIHKDYEDYYPSYSLLNKQSVRMVVCKDCVDSLWKSYLLRYTGQLSKALYYFCMLLDVPYFQNILEEVKQMDEGLGFFKKYMSKVLMYGRQNNAVTFLDGQLLFDGTNERTPAFFDYDEDEVSYIPTVQDVKFWGKLAPQDIFYLKDQYEDWRNRYEVKDKGMEEVVKQICHKQLRIQRLNEQGANTSKELKDMQDLMTSANLKPVQNKNLAGEENTLGNWIRRFENERPIPAPDPEFEDVDGIWRKIRVWFLGHFSKIYNYDNEYSREYEQEMSKYRVDTKEKYETKWATHQMGKELFKDE